MKKILIVDDSALMRRIIYDIIATDNRFQVSEMVSNGVEALDLLQRNSYDVMILDVIMPKMDGITLLKEMRRRNITTKVIVFSSVTKKGADITLEALNLGAVDFIYKPQSILDAKTDTFLRYFLDLLSNTAGFSDIAEEKDEYLLRSVKPVRTEFVKGRNTIVAIASSTGGPKALQAVIAELPPDLDAPVIVVQHMPAGFTESLAARLNSMSYLHVMEAAEGVEIKKGHVYIAKGGIHLKVLVKNQKHILHLTNEPSREGVKPCANYMYESLAESGYDSAVCVVLTGMGADGTEGIKNLHKKKPIYVIAQNKETCAVYGMPRSITVSGMVNEIQPLDSIASAIITNVGVK